MTVVCWKEECLYLCNGDREGKGAIGIALAPYTYDTQWIKRNDTAMCAYALPMLCAHFDGAAFWQKNVRIKNAVLLAS